MVSSLNSNLRFTNQADNDFSCPFDMAIVVAVENMIAVAFFLQVVMQEFHVEHVVRQMGLLVVVVAFVLQVVMREFRVEHVIRQKGPVDNAIVQKVSSETKGETVKAGMDAS
jgi:hypothetical protein